MALNQPVYELGSWMCMGYKQQHDMADFKWENDDQSAFFWGGSSKYETNPDESVLSY